LALVSIAWLFLASQQEIKITFSASVRFENAAPELLGGQDAMKTVDLTVSGRPRQINEVKPEAVRVRVNLKGLAAGKHRIRLSGKNIDLPFGVKVEQITPPVIEVNLPAN
jgi:YbbR domain-containing protein